MKVFVSEFEQSVDEIVGLTEYHARRLPPWLRERILDDAFLDVQDGNDEELMAAAAEWYGGSSWLRSWGEATLSGNCVLLCEVAGFRDPILLAGDLGCGIAFLEPSDTYYSDAMTAYIIEHGRRHV